MGHLPKKTFYTFTVIGLIFTLIGSVFLVLSVLFFVQDHKFYANAVEVDGAISQIYHEKVTVDYEYQGQTYSSRLGYYSSSMRTGDTLTLYCDADHPEKVRVKSSLLLNIIFLIVGIAFPALGICLIAADRRRIGRYSRLKSEGRRIMASLSDVQLELKFTRNYRHPYVIYCQYPAPDGCIYTFKSAPIWFNPTGLNHGDPVPVYVNGDDYTKYYVDVEQLLPRNIEK